MGEETFELARIGWVESSLDDVTAAPKQGIEGAPDAFLVFHSRFEKALQDVEAGDEIVVLTWLHRAQRDVLRVHPRDNPATPLRGVFSTRSADRPNPIGLHRVQVLEKQGIRLRVRHLEAVNGTPVLDVKPVLDRRIER